MSPYVRQSVKIAALLLLAAGLALPQSRSERYVLVLTDPPLARQTNNRKALKTKAAAAQRETLESKQRNLRATLADRGIRVTGALHTLANVVFVMASEEQAHELAQLPGVRYVARDMPAKRHMNAALDVIRAREAWNDSLIGGPENAGRDIRIGILDTGIEQTHAAFNDPDLHAPAGFPMGDANFTNNKVIVARSYVAMLVLPGDVDFSRPDDLSPRDRVGHGTAAAMVAAGRQVDGPAGPISGVAPKAFLGNYKIFGSPGVNDITFSSAIAQALEDAFNDGMDIVSISAGSPALWSPDDTGGVCGESPGVLCDWRVEAVENATAGGMIVVASAGNDGDLGARYPDVPSFGSVNSPGTAPSAITVGASTNSHIYYQSVMAGNKTYRALFGDGPHPNPTLKGRLVDVGQAFGSSTACDTLPGGSLGGAVALVVRGGCAFETKVYNAQNAGASAVIIYQGQSEGLFPMDKLELTGIPALMVANSTGTELQKALADNADLEVTIDATWKAVDASSGSVAYFSSLGPSLGLYEIKPEVVAVGTDLYVATQTYDPNGDMYDRTGFTVGHGTSLAAPMAAGAAALVLQANQQWFSYWQSSQTAYLVPENVKSALVNTAHSVSDADGKAPASVTAAGAGQIDVWQAVKTTITAAPATLSFGGNPALGLQFRNYGDSQVVLRLGSQPRAGGGVTFSASTVTLPAGQGANVTVTRIAQTTPGIYEGFVVAEGGPVALRIPYLYLVSDRVPANIVALRGADFLREQNGPVTLTLRVVDRYGVGIPNTTVRFAPLDADGNRVSPNCNPNTDARGNDWGCIDTTLATTDALGIMEAKAFAGSQLGEEAFEAYLTNSDLNYVFPGRVRVRPAVDSVANLASGDEGPLVAGGYVALRGHGLSAATKVSGTDLLPYSMLGVSVSFDLPDKSLSYAGRLLYVSDGQVFVQVPWELASETGASVKVSNGDLWSSPRQFRVSAAAPEVFVGGVVDGRNVALAFDESGAAISADNPARKDKIVSVLVNALGPVSGPPPTGETPAGNPPSTVDTPAATVGGVPAAVQFSGLTADRAGVYVVKMRISPNTPSGLQPIAITAKGVTSKAVYLPISE